MYLKWLVNRSGERVPEDLAVEAFSHEGWEAEEVLERWGWSFRPVAGLPSLKGAVGLLLAQAEYKRYLASTRK